MAQINPYIHFNGNAEEAFEFYRSVFGGAFSSITRFRDIPSNPEFPIPANEADKLMHISLPIGKDHFLLGSDTPASMGKHNENETRSKIYLSTDTREEAIRLYNGLSAGGQVEVPLAAEAEGPCFAMFRDRYGIEWIVNFESNQN